MGRGNDGGGQVDAWVVRVMRVFNNFIMIRRLCGQERFLGTGALEQKKIPVNQNSRVKHMCDVYCCMVCVQASVYMMCVCM